MSTGPGASNALALAPVALRWKADPGEWELENLGLPLTLALGTIASHLEVSLHHFRPFLWTRHNLRARLVHVAGICVDRFVPYHKLLCFVLDDGTACVRCVSFRPADRGPQGPGLSPEAWSKLAERVQVGRLFSVHGSLKRYKGKVEIQVTTAKWERDPSKEHWHWLECAETSRLIEEAVERHARAQGHEAGRMEEEAGEKQTGAQGHEAGRVLVKAGRAQEDEHPAPNAGPGADSAVQP